MVSIAQETMEAAVASAKVLEIIFSVLLINSLNKDA
jgi:hypothetical protein